MQLVRTLLATTVVVAFCSNAAQSQDPPKPGPEHELLKKHVGTWDLTMNAGGMEFKGVVTYKMDLGDLWLAAVMESDLGGMKFSGRSWNTFDAGKQKYLTVWFDNMSTHPMFMEGTYDKDKKTLTMVGDGPGPDGKPTKWKSLTTFTDDNTMSFSMLVGDAKEPMFTIVYKKKK